MEPTRAAELHQGCSLDGPKRATGPHRTAINVLLYECYHTSLHPGTMVFSVDDNMMSVVTGISMMTKYVAPWSTATAMVEK